VLRTGFFHRLLCIGGVGYVLGGGGGVVGMVFCTKRSNSVCRHCISYDDTLGACCGGGGSILL
jgi:hypothetical protein